MVTRCWWPHTTPWFSERGFLRFKGRGGSEAPLAGFKVSASGPYCTEPFREPCLPSLATVVVAVGTSVRSCSCRRKRKPQRRVHEREAITKHMTTKSILQVEDDENDRFLLKRVFEHTGITS